MATIPDLHMRISVHGGAWRKVVDSTTLIALAEILAITTESWQSIAIRALCSVTVLAMACESLVDWWQKRTETPKDGEPKAD